MSRLCKACRQINWAVIDTAIDEKKRITWRGLPVLEVGHRFRDIPNSSRCPLCRMLHAPWIESFLQSEHGTNWKDFDEGDWIHLFPNLRHIHHVNDFPSSRNLLRHHEAPYHIAVIPKIKGWRKELRKRIYQHLVTDGMVVVLQEDSPESEVFHPQTIPAQFNPATVQRWLRGCARHQKLCNPKQPSVPGMRVIDCQSEGLEILVYNPGDEYMTLSYVWGKVEQPQPDQSVTAGSKAPLARLPDDIPLTIRHAIEVTKALDCRYLWVDKYCIDQDDPTEMQEQFSRMGDIYAGSSLTIFALGEDAERGLPGVGSTPRLIQEQCRNGMYSFISSTPDPHWLIQQSDWATRGWTFQEGLFSTRSLFFTDYQVYFECNAMNCLESFKSNRKILHIRSGQRFKAMHRAGQYICGNSNQNSHFMVRNNNANHRKVDVMRQLQRQISLYTKRQLSHPSDVLDAFAGVTRFYARSNVRVASLAGIPVPFPFVLLPDTMQLGLDNLSYALAWSHVVDNFDTDFPRRYTRGPWVFNEAEVDAGGSRSRGRQLAWSSRRNRKPQRRYGFPSWSWAGWFGEVTMRRDFPYCWTSLLREVKIEFENGQVKDLSWLQESARYNAAVIRKHRTAKVLYFYAFVLDPENLDLSDALEDSESPTIRVCMSDGPNTVKGLRQQLLDRRLECLVLGTHGRARDEVFSAIRNADRKSSRAKHRRIELLGRGGPGTIVCLVVRTNVYGESFRVGLLEVKYASYGCDGGQSALRGWNTGPRRRFVLK